MEYSYLDREEDYYREGVWKIYYRIQGECSYSVGKAYNKTLYLFRNSPHEIKFSGKDAEIKSLAVLALMLEGKI